MGRKKKHLTDNDKQTAQRESRMKYYWKNAERIRKYYKDKYRKANGLEAEVPASAKSQTVLLETPIKPIEEETIVFPVDEDGNIIEPIRSVCDIRMKGALRKFVKQ